MNPVSSRRHRPAEQHPKNSDCSKFGSHLGTPHRSDKNRPERGFSPHLRVMGSQNIEVMPHRQRFYQLSNSHKEYGVLTPTPVGGIIITSTVQKLRNVYH